MPGIALPRDIASADRSKARTANPFFNRFAAMPPPILPRPMKPIVWVIPSILFRLTSHISRSFIPNIARG